MSPIFPPGEHNERLMRCRAELDALSVDELRGVEVLLMKLRAGSKKHGPLVLATDTRDWNDEMRSEFADAAWYSIWFELTRNHEASAQRVVQIPSVKDIDTSDVVPLHIDGAVVMLSDIDGGEEDEVTVEWRAAEGGG